MTSVIPEVFCYTGIMSEQLLEIPIPETELKVHGVLRGDYDSPFAILMPGLGGWMHDGLLFNAARAFEKKGISSLRVSFYGDGEDQRNINDYDVNNCAEDIDVIVDYVKGKGTQWVSTVGHSYSGMAIVYSKKQQFDGAVLWDPSHTDGYSTLEAQFNLKKDFKYDKELDAYVSALGSGYVISRKVFENYEPGSVEKSKRFKVPTLIINAGYSKAMQDYGKKYADSINAPTEQTVIPNVSHSFTEDGAMEKLFELTTEWIQKQVSDPRSNSLKSSKLVH